MDPLVDGITAALDHLESTRPASEPHAANPKSSLRRQPSLPGINSSSAVKYRGNSDIARSASEVCVIAHRGASGRFPEHSQKGYHEAVRAGADVIEMDCCATKDGHIIVRHDVLLDGDSTVAEMFPESRMTFEKVSGSMDGDFDEAKGYFVHNFTLEEVKQLRCVQRMPGRSHEYDGQLSIQTLKEACSYLEELRQHVMVKYHGKRDFGIYVETKRAAWHKSLGVSLERQYVLDLMESGFKGRVYVQSFEPASLKEIKLHQQELLPDAEWVYIRLLTSDEKGRQRGYSAEVIEQLLPLPWIRDENGLCTNQATPDGVQKLDQFFEEISTYAQGIGPWKNDLLPDPTRQLLESPVIEMAHKHGLAVHPYTFRSDVSRLPECYFGNAAEEYCRFFKLGVDGVFSDFPSHARHARYIYEMLGEEFKFHGFEFLDRVHPELLQADRESIAQDDGH